MLDEMERMVFEILNNDNSGHGMDHILRVKDLSLRFAKAEDAAFYNYQRIETQIVNLVNRDYKAGDKLPSIKDLAKRYEVSTNTIRKALLSLEQDGFITFGRGRFGGTFVIEKPENAEKQSYQWLSINPNYM